MFPQPITNDKVSDKSPTSHRTRIYMNAYAIPTEPGTSGTPTDHLVAHQILWHPKWSDQMQTSNSANHAINRYRCMHVAYVCVHVLQCACMCMQGLEPFSFSSLPLSSPSPSSIRILFISFLKQWNRVTVKVNFNLKISFIYKKTENASSRMKRRTSDGKKNKKTQYIVKVL